MVAISAGAIEEESGYTDDEEGLRTGDTVQLDVTSQSGGTRQVILTVSQQLAGKKGDPVTL